MAPRMSSSAAPRGGLPAPPPISSSFATPRRPPTDRVLLDHAVESVGAEDEYVALLQGKRSPHIDLDLFGHTHRSLQDVPPRVVLGLDLRQQPLAHHGGDERVVLRELANLIAAHHVDSGVADVPPPGVAVADHQRRRRRAHAAQIGIGLSLMEDARVGARERVAERHGDVIALAAEVLGLYGLAGDSGCRGAATVAAHAVGYDQQPPARMRLPLFRRRRVEAEVLVFRAHQPYVGAQYRLHHEWLARNGRSVCRGGFAHAWK